MSRPDDIAGVRGPREGSPSRPVERLGFGLAAIGRPAYITSGRQYDLGDRAHRTIAEMRQRALRLLDEAWLLGLRYFDVARSYGAAEEFLGGWLKLHPERRSELTIGSKWGYEYVAGWRVGAGQQERKEHTLRMFERQWPQTLSSLGSPPDVYFIHSLTPDSPALSDRHLLEALRTLAASGVRVGFSSSGPHQGDVIEAARRVPDSPFTAVEATWNLLEPSAAPALADVHNGGWLVVLKEVLANGRLAPGGEEAARAHADAAGVSVDQLAIGAALENEWADIVLSGAVTPEQLRSNIEAPPLDGPAAAIESLRIAPELYWQQRSARPWA